MKKKYFLSLCHVVFCSLLILFTTNCSKESENPESEPTALNTEKSQYAPYEVVTISTSEKIISQPSTTAKINNLEIPLDITDGKVSFLLPNLNNGKYTLSFSSNEIKYEVPITVESLSNVLSADVYFTEMTSNVAANINKLNAQMNELEQSSYYSTEHIALKNDISKYTNLLNSYTESYKQLTEEQKKEFAKMIAANKTVFDIQSVLINKLSTYTLKQTQSVSDYEENVKEKATVFIESIFHTIDLIPKVVGLAILAKTPIHPFINAGAILAAGIYVAKFMISATTTVAAAVNLISASIKPSEFIAETNKIAALEYNTGIEKAINIRANYRSLIASDSNDSGSTIQSIVENYNSFKEKYTGFINELPDLFKPSYSLSALKNIHTNTTRSVFNKYLSITNISNPNVTLEQINQQDGSIKIKASTSSNTDQTFTYDVNYTNRNFTTDMKKTVSAKVFVKTDSIAYYKSKLHGNWIMNFGDQSLEKNFYNFDNTNYTGNWYGGVTGAGESYEQTGNIGYVSPWNVLRNEKGYYVEIILPNRGHKILAYIRLDRNDLDFFNAFNI
jgi:hypothetical protein